MRAAVQHLLALGVFLALVTPTMAQSVTQFVSAFSGNWMTFDRRNAAGQGFCQVVLANGPADALQAKASGCTTPLSDVASWGIQDNQLALLNSAHALIVKLGGNEKRITGMTASGLPIVLERSTGDSSTMTLIAARNASHCYYKGYTSTCATDAELGMPVPALGGPIQIQTLVNLNAHSQPRADSSVTATIAENTCVKVTSCVMASDGPWCEANSGGNTIWLRKEAVRQNRWPIITYLNSCSKQ